MYVFYLALLALASAEEFRTVYEWNQLTFKFPNEDVKNSLMASDGYIPENNMPVGVGKWENYMYVTVPRWKNGVASTLNRFPMNDTNMSPVLEPYPDWDSNDIRKPGALVSIFRVRTDPCGRMWGVDTGFDGDKMVRPMTLVAIDLKTDKIVLSYQLKDSDLKPDSYIADLVVDDAEGCDDLYIYMSDFGGSAIVVYSLAKNDSWRVEHNFFHFDPLNGDYNVKGLNFQWTDGVFGMSLSPVRDDSKSRILYFHAMSGIREFAVNTTVMKDEMLDQTLDYYDFHLVGVKGENTQGPSSVIDQNTGIDYFTQPVTNSMSCWDTSVPLNPKTFKRIEQNNETLSWANDLAICYETDTLYVLSNNLPRFDHSLLTSKETNYFITAATLDSLTEKCMNM